MRNEHLLIMKAGYVRKVKHGSTVTPSGMIIYPKNQNNIELLKFTVNCGTTINIHAQTKVT